MSDGIDVGNGVVIPRSELEVRATKSGGAGGQHVNTSSTRIELLWNVRETRALGDELRTRVLTKLSTRIDGEGVLRVVASDRRSQLQNREQAEERLAELVRRALIVPKKRRPTRPTRAAKEARLSEKKRRGERKANRRKDAFD